MKLKQLTTPHTKITENFKFSEFFCKDTNRTSPPVEYSANIIVNSFILEAIRKRIGKPLNINSAYRTTEHNKVVGGSSSSNHLTAMAVDISCKDMKGFQIRQHIDNLISFGIIPSGEVITYPNFVHYAPNFELSIIMTLIEEYFKLKK